LKTKNPAPNRYSRVLSSVGFSSIIDRQPNHQPTAKSSTGGQIVNRQSSSIANPNRQSAAKSSTANRRQSPIPIVNRQSPINRHSALANPNRQSALHNPTRQSAFCSRQFVIVPAA